MDNYNNDNRMYLASSGNSSQIQENSRDINSISSEPLERYIYELRSDLRNELKGISNIKWK